MSYSLRLVVAGLMALVISGCAATGHETATVVTHEWVATDRVAQIHFNENNRDCMTKVTEDVGQYERCMLARGYEPFEP